MESKFPKYHGQHKVMVRAINNWLSNNGSLPVDVKLGKGHAVTFWLVDVRINDWHEGTEVYGVVQVHKVATEQPEQHITLNQHQINSLWRQMGYTARNFQPGFAEYEGAH